MFFKIFKNIKLKLKSLEVTIIIKKNIFLNTTSFFSGVTVVFAYMYYYKRITFSKCYCCS